MRGLAKEGTGSGDDPENTNREILKVHDFEDSAGDHTDKRVVHEKDSMQSVGSTVG
ncbi:MAG: hypothetical protein HY434_00640 [Candidatus Liptonbacteria bacterium]|nr:hypothetical protein [Candidatus Liptonbacteria bacterium]